MLRTRLQQFINSVRQGINAGFAAGMVVIFLILIGIPLNLPNLALFLLWLIPILFGIRLARRLREADLGQLVKNALAMSFVAALLVWLLISLINRWQAQGVDVKQYFDSVSTKTTSMLSGVPEQELHPHPPTNPLTGEVIEAEPTADQLRELYNQIDLAEGQYSAEFLTPTNLRYRLTVTPPEGEFDPAQVTVEDLDHTIRLMDRTSPMRLTFDPDTGLEFRFGLTGESWLTLNMGIGGFYGFLLLLMGFGMVGALLTRAAINANIAQYRSQSSRYLAGNPVAHWLILLLPVFFFAFLWLTVRQGDLGTVLPLGAGGQELQLLTSFLIILTGLISMRTAQPTDWHLPYPVRLGIVLAAIVILTLLGIWRVLGTNTYFIAPPTQPAGSALLCVLTIIAVAVVLAVQNGFALRRADRFESQFAGTVSLGVLALMPMYLSQYQNDVMTLVGINILLGLGLNIVVGYTGLLNLGYVAFFALGAYTYAFLSSNQRLLDSAELKFEGNDAMVIQLGMWIVTTVIVASLVIAGGLYVWRRAQMARSSSMPSSRSLLNLPPYPSKTITWLLTGLAVGTSLIVALILKAVGADEAVFKHTSPFLIGLLVGTIVSGIAGILLGIPVLRLRGDYLAIVTLGFGEIIRLLFNNLRDLTGGPQGVLGIPRPLPDDASGTATYLALVYLVFLGAGLVAFLSARLQNSRTGRAWSAMRSDEDIAQSMGVNLVQSKLTAFAIGTAFAGIGGVLFAARQRNIFPADFRLDVSIEVLSLVIIGGMGSIPGVIMGAVVLIGIPEVLRELSTYRILVFGALLVAMVIIRPKGLLPAPVTQLQDRARALVHRSEESQP